MHSGSDRSYAIACGRLASRLGISQASARRRVEILAAREGQRDLAARLALAERLLSEAEGGGDSRSLLFDDALQALASEANFMTED
ncbi:MAG: hypothetical protein VKI83_10765 [Synechococcaceae cyanobacterium]|nr:hypothetical protein [Synechococcaceae cyanobacterium]